MKKVLLALLIFSSIFKVQSQTNFFWRTEATNGNWAGTTNWWNGAATAAGFGVLIFDNNNQLTMNNNTSGTLSTHRIEFRTGASSVRSISGNPVRLYDFSGSDPKIENQTSAHHVISFNIEGDGDASDPLELNPVSGNLTLSGTINNQGSPISVYGNAGNTLNLDGIISGSGAFTIHQNSNVIMTAQNSYSGLTTITAGSLRLNRAGGTTIPTTNSITVSGGTLRVSSNQTINNLDLIGGGNLTIDAGVTLTITGTYTPGTGTINNQGTLELQGSGALNFPTSTSITNMNNLTINRSSGTVTLNQNLTITGTLTLSAGTFAVSSQTLNLNGGAIAGTPANLATTSSSNLSFGGTNAGPLDVPSSVVNLNNLTINNTSGTPAIIRLNSSPTISGALALTSGTLSIGASNTLTLAGTVTRTSGFLRGSTTSNLTLTNSSALGSLFFDHTTPGTTNALANFTKNSGAGSVTIGNNSSVGATEGQLYINGILTVSAGSLDVNQTVTGNHIVLVSDGTNQARVANTTGGTITQGANTKIVVERFASLPATSNNRSWRFITAPLTGNLLSLSRTVQNQWQNTSSVLGSTSFGTNIYGPSGSTGMDGTTAGNTMRGWDYSTKAYASVSNTTTEVLFGNSGSADNKPYMLFVRGDKTRTPTNGLTGSTRLRAVGRLQVGNQAFSYPTANTTDFVAAANPYACQIDWELIRTDGTALTNINSTQYFLWDPRSGNFGAWVTVNSDGSGGYFTVPTSPASFSASSSRYIQSGQAFFVKVSSNGTSGITFKESHKVTTNANATITGAGNGLMDRLGVDLLLINPDNSLSVRDGLLMKYKNNYSTAINEASGEDVVKLSQADETISIVQGSTKLGIEGRGYIQNTDTVRIQMERMTTGSNYKFAFFPQNFDATVADAKLIDKFLNTETPISLTANSEVNFTITSTTGSNAADRFMIVFRGSGNLPNRGLSVQAVKQNTGVQVNWEAQAEAGVKEYELQHSATGTSFTSLTTQAAKNGAITNNYNYHHSNPVSGVNYYRIKATDLNDNVRYSNVITINLKAQGNTPITVYPNPVRGKTIGLQVEGIEKGEYSLRVVNAQGQTVYSQNLQIQGNMSMQVTTNQLLAKGNYTVQLINNKGANYQQQVLVVE